ncbi:MAG: hypothetical protein JOY82_24845 [Streptosporangiaceae bacterium]|nr:hypothetical protein [Streptosporangiaceae bacterium]MBV9857713.1 hypothetical protein [Streptosporangiaceae bacterium]
MAVVTAGFTASAGHGVFGLTSAIVPDAFALAVAGAVLTWDGWMAYTRRRKIPDTQRFFLPLSRYVHFALAWIGAGLLGAAIGAMLDTTGWLPAEIPGVVLIALGAASIAAGFVFYVHLPTRLRPAWLRGEQRANAAQPPPARPIRLAHHLLRSSPETSEEMANQLAPQMTGSQRPRLMVPGTISGPLPYEDKVSGTARRGSLWVYRDRLLFVQSAEDDRRLGESYFVEIPAGKLHGMRPARAGAGKPALELDVDRGVLTFSHDGDVAALERDIREVLGL